MGPKFCAVTLDPLPGVLLYLALGPHICSPSPLSADYDGWMTLTQCQAHKSTFYMCKMAPASINGRPGCCWWRPTQSLFLPLCIKPYHG